MEFHAKRHWRPKEVTGDPEEEDEEESDEAKNGFSLEEVLRLGGTKVTAAGAGQGGAAHGRRECGTRSPASDLS